MGSKRSIGSLGWCYGSYVIITDRSLEALSMKCFKRWGLKELLQVSRDAIEVVWSLRIDHTRGTKHEVANCSHKSGVDVTSCHHHPNMKMCEVCNENLVEDEYHSLIACSTYIVSNDKYDHFLDGHDNVKSHTQMSTMKDESHPLFSHI